MNGKKYIILEIIPTAVDPSKGFIAQISALKLSGYIIEDRFDYRLEESKVGNPYVLEMMNYDKDKFQYENNSKNILDKFIKWIEDYDLLIIDNQYTINFLESIENKKESIFLYLDMDYSDDVIEKIINKYKLEKSNYIVDLLYEALIFKDKGDTNGTSK